MMSINVKNGLFIRYLLKYWFSNPHGWPLKKVIKEKVRAVLPARYSHLKSLTARPAEKSEY
jgi:hypothetical protein